MKETKHRYSVVGVLIGLMIGIVFGVVVNSVLLAVLVWAIAGGSIGAIFDFRDHSTLA